MPLTGFASASIGFPPLAPWRQTPRPSEPSAGKVGAGAVVLGGTACRIAADQAKASSHWTIIVERILYPAWSIAAAALTALRSAQLPAIARGASPAGWLGLGSFRLGEAMPVLATVEAMVAGVRCIAVQRKVAALKQRIAATAAQHGRCQAALRERVASRREGVPLADRAVRCQQRHAMRTDGSLDAFLAHRRSVAKQRDSKDKRLQARLTAARDTVVQGGVVATGAAQILSRLLPTVAMALPGASIAGCAASVAMSLAHIITGRVQRHEARKDVARWQRRGQALRRSPLAIALAGRDREGAAATVCAAAPLSMRQQSIVGGADAARTRQLTDFYRTVLQQCDDRISAARQSAQNDVCNANLRIAYGAGTLGVNGALLGLTVAALATVTAATAGMALMVVGGAMGLCWLGFAIYKMRAWRRGQQAAQGAALAARQALEPVARADAAPGKTIAEACLGVDAAAADPARANLHLTATRVIEHLQARGSAEALAERTMARALMRALGADAEVVAGIEAAQTPKQCRLALKLVMRYLDGRCIDPGREPHEISEEEADGASTCLIPAQNDTRTPLLGRMAEGAGAR